MSERNENNLARRPSPRGREDLLRVCRVGRAQGLKGEVNVFAYTDEPELRFARGSTLVTLGGRRFTVRRSRTFKKRWILSLEGVDSRTAAEKLTGLTLSIPRSEAERQDAAAAESNPEGSLAEEGYFLEDLVQLRAQAPDGTPLGTVTNVLDGVAQDLLQVTEPGGHVSLVPFVKAFVRDVDPDAGRIILDVPRGLLAEYPKSGSGREG